MWYTGLKNSLKIEIFKKKQNFYELLKNRIFRKLTTDIENCKWIQAETRNATFLEWSTRLYLTEQVQSILQPEISTHFEHFRFECKDLKFV